MNLRAFLNSLTVSEQHDFAKRCRTSLGYLRKALSKNQKIGAGLCIEIEKHSGEKVRCEEIRNDIDWAYLRGTARNPKELS